jgi:hypothetical protein
MLCCKLVPVAQPPPLTITAWASAALCGLFVLPPHSPVSSAAQQEQRIRASHGIKKLSQQIKEQRLKVADRITKRIGIKPGSSSAAGSRKAAAAAAAAAGQDGSSSGGEGGSGSREYADNVKRGDLLAELIRRNGEELATSVEGVVERVGVAAAGVLCCQLILLIVSFLLAGSECCW